MRSLPPLNPLLAFEAASRHLSFTRAARELSVTQGAISHQIATLEEYFGARLFERRSNQLVLTPAAQAYAQALQGAFEEMRRATSAFHASASIRSTLTIKGYPLLLSRWLTPRLPAFSRQYPDIDVRLVSVSGASLVDFENQGIDVGIRYGSGRWRGLTSHLLFADELVPVCTKELAQHLSLHDAPSFAGQVLLQTHARARDWPDWFACAGVDDAQALRKLMSFEDLGIVHRFAIEGSGIAILQKAYVDDDIREGRLVVPCGPVLRRELGYHLVTPSDQRREAKVQEFSDWLLATI
ncbi:LysR substrate-binding domain-containing protein [Pinirhizobacter soli]|uniref:LysR substrate-binding domain-containing protein n=1 Tax=Pinirhizobacter soli TaxID=2786953 RepID=UPI002029F338|nr:LysR substrate-binding domain-containing protein [Pinirhizobacter soli]